ncbi:hypothetical protein ACJIZ3_004349 [Penstemon smallii]|uniref:Cytochrome P450 n=1 Tax=Penstemon smallii TaxID=265156 RepID=A0ABD3S1T5_9LAMI
MDVITAVMLVLLLLVLAWSYVLGSNSSRHRGNLAPGPYPFPIIGNIFDLGRKPHQSLAKLSKTYGPLMSLHLGSKYTVVVTSPEMAKEILQKNDKVFSSRNIHVAAQAHDHHNHSMGYLPVGSQWNKIRRLCREQLFSIQCLEAGQGLRQEKLRQLCDYVQECCLSGQVVDIGKAAFTTTLNLMSVTLVSVDFSNYKGSDSSNEWEEAILGVMNVVGIPNFADFFPILKLVDPQGVKRKADKCFGRLLEMFEDIINQRIEYSKNNNSTKKKDLLEVLLDPTHGSEYNLSSFEIKHLLLDLIVGGSDPTATIIEWAMTELLRNPKIMSTAKDELKSVLGGNKQAKESDILRLPYLQAVVKETFRFHPPGPLLIPRSSDYDTDIMGYLIPKNTQIIVNVWAMGRDSSLWSNPDSFEPERFLNNKVDFKGRDFELIPFGAGRRICPGMPLTDRMVHLVLAYLIHNFDWVIGKQTEADDTGEKFGLSLHRAAPLKALPIKP